MKYTENIDAALAFVKEEFDRSSYFQTHIPEKEYRFNHSIRVANLGLRIAAGEGFDPEAMVLGCLLHDISYRDPFISEQDLLDHGRNSARIAREFLAGRLSSDKINEICLGIAIHVDGKADFPGNITPFANSIGDADNLDRLGAYRTFETLEYVDFREKKLEEQKQWLLDAIDDLRDWEAEGFSTPTANRIMNDLIAKRIDFYTQLTKQLDNSSHLIFPPLLTNH